MRSTALKSSAQNPELGGQPVPIYRRYGKDIDPITTPKNDLIIDLHYSQVLP